MKKMTYETHKPIDAPTHKKSPKSKQSQHDYTIRSEWGAKAFEFWWWKRNTKQTDQPHQEMKTNDQEMKSMSRTYRYTQENHTPKNRQKRSGKNKLEWNTFREQSRDVSEMSKIEGFHGNWKSGNFNSNPNDQPHQ